VYKPLLVAGCGGYHSWLPCGNSTTKRIGNATAHTRGRQPVQKLLIIVNNHDFSKASKKAGFINLSL